MGRGQSGNLGREEGVFLFVIWVVVPWEAPGGPHWIAGSVHYAYFPLHFGNAALIYATTWENPENIMLSENRHKDHRGYAPLSGDRKQIRGCQGLGEELWGVTPDGISFEGGEMF